MGSYANEKKNFLVQYIFQPTSTSALMNFLFMIGLVGELCHGVWNLLRDWFVVYDFSTAVWLLLLLLSLLWKLRRKWKTG